MSTPAPPSSSPPAEPVDLLILGAGWTSTFLIPLCAGRGGTHAATTRTGRAGTLAFEFDPHSDDPAPFAVLPCARTVLVTFPIYVPGASERLVRLYQQTHAGGVLGVGEGDGEGGGQGKGRGKLGTAFIQLGSTGIWGGGPTARGEDGDHVARFQRPDIHRESPFEWTDRHSPFNEGNDRARAESELLALAPATPTTVLNLCGFWGGQRQVKGFVPRVITSKEILANKGCIHMIHGLDISRAILAVHAHFDRAVGQRWLVTDGHVYDWWDWAAAWGEEGKQTRWVRELMTETGVHALPRAAEVIGRAMDSREFWNTFDLEPVKGRLGEE